LPDAIGYRVAHENGLQCRKRGRTLVKIAFVGKGGSGKTTLSALFVRHLSAAGSPVLAIDADINQHLAVALGADDDHAAALPPLGAHLPLIKEYLRGSNPRIASADAMVKTTPPGRGSRLLRVDEDNPVYAACVREVAGVRLAVTGAFTEQDLGVACYHSKVGAVELLLNHLLDGPGEYVVVDMTAGADSFASGLFTRFDRTFLVCEPTVRSVAVYRQYVGHAREYGIAVSVIGNKVEDEGDVEFLREHVGEDLLGWVGRSAFVRSAERGVVLPIGELEPANRDVLARMAGVADATQRDWARYTELAAEFHRRNAYAWANARAGADLTEQIDPEFVLPGAESPAGRTAVGVGAR
jgi:CO dehydrogenase maturation factor